MCWSLIWDCCCFVPLRLRYGGVFCAGFLGCFFCPSLVGESPLSLLLLRFMDISIGSIVVNDCSVAVVDADDDCSVLMVDVEVVAVEILVTVVGSVDEFTLFSVVDGFFMGVFFPFFGYLDPSFVVFFIEVVFVVFTCFNWCCYCDDR